MSIRIFNPTSGPIPENMTMASRPVSLDNCAVGVIDNGKLHSDVVLKLITDGLKKQYKLKDIIAIKKDSVSHSIRDEEAQRLSAQCDIALAGVGD